MMTMTIAHWKLVVQVRRQAATRPLTRLNWPSSAWSVAGFRRSLPAPATGPRPGGCSWAGRPRASPAPIRPSTGGAGVVRAGHVARVLLSQFGKR